MVHWLVFDIDRAEAGAAWIDAFLPPPAWVARNPSNGHAHIVYGLTNPVCRSDAGRLAPLRYAAAVERGLGVALGADASYSGLITKNPLDHTWRVTYQKGAGGLYELDELNEYVDTSTAPQELNRQGKYIAGLGRNCDLFERLRLWSYGAIRRGWPAYDEWAAAVLNQAAALNDYVNPLIEGEVRTIARSVSNWTHERFSPQAFSRIQAERGMRGGKKSRGGGRPTQVDSERQRMPWVALGISRRTYQRRKKMAP